MWRMGWRGMISDLRDLGHVVATPASTGLKVSAGTIVQRIHALVRVDDVMFHIELEGLQSITPVSPCLGDTNMSVCRRRTRRKSS